ncbi:MAG: copper resistance protein CopC, partial [Candidatus Acidiferrales bacterium]
MGARQTLSIHRVVPALVFLLVIPILMVVSARPVEAHSTVVSSRPAPGERLASAPGIVTIQFSEPVNASLSH